MARTNERGNQLRIKVTASLSMKIVLKKVLAALEGFVPKGSKIGCTLKVLVRPDDILHDDYSPRKARIIGVIFKVLSCIP